MCPTITPHALIPLTLLAASALPQAARAERPRPLRLRIESPRNNVSQQWRSGWPLRFSLTPKEDTFGIVTQGNAYAGLGERSALVFRELDGCLSLIDPSCPIFENEELYLRFNTDVDLPGVLDQHGDPALRAALTSTVTRPYLRYKGIDNAAGPGLAVGVEDGLGFGANDDLPGFVLLSNVGVGKVLDGELGVPGAVTGFEELVPKQARNLAGLMTDVSFELRARPERSTIHTSLIVPPGLFSRLRVVDRCFGAPPFSPCELGMPIQAIDGGPFSPMEFPADEASVLVSHPVELRAVVVEGVAPAFVVDCNQDDKLTAADLVCMGYNLLSNEVKLSFEQLDDYGVCAVGVPKLWPGSSITTIDVDITNNKPLIFLHCPTGGDKVGTLPM